MLRRTALALCLSATPALAQDDRDPGFLAGLIEDNVSAPGLVVQIDGFSGALSSSATIEELRLSDDEGTWLVARDLVLDWNRSALLSGRLEVDALTAGLIRLERPPLPAESEIEVPTAAASGFTLPTLPVAVDIGRLAASRIELGAAILGQDIAMTLQASAQLDGGSGQTVIQAARLDGPVGVFSIQAAYDAGDTPAITLNLDIREAEGGIAATMLSLPGAPAIELSVQGDGPLDNFDADIRLASNGAQRLGGRVSLDGVEDGRRFAANLRGDVTELFAPRYKPFFGDNVGLVAQGVQRDDGRLELETLDLSTEALTLNGTARLDADGWPEFLDITGTLADEDGGPVLLPTSSDVTLRRAELELVHDAAVSEDFRLNLTVAELSQADLTIEAATLSADGLLDRDGGKVLAATATIDAAVEGLGFVDPTLAQTVGDAVTFTTNILWDQTQPVQLSDLALQGQGYALRGGIGLIETTQETAGVPLSLDLRATVEDLARLSGLTGQSLAGRAELATRGAIDPLAGTFDLVVQGLASNLGVGIAQADALLTGQTVLFVDASRSLQGTELEALRLTNDQLSFDASTRIFGEDSDARAAGQTGEATVRASIADGSLIDPRLTGAITLAGDLTQSVDGNWAGQVDATGPHGVTLTTQGQLTGDAPDVSFAANVPELAPFAPDIPGGANLSGRAFAQGGVWSIEADATGPWGLTARVDGPVTGANVGVAFDATLPQLADPVPAIATIPPLNGSVSLTGLLTQPDGVWAIDTQAELQSGITAQVSGPLINASSPLAFDVIVPQIEAFSQALETIEPLNGKAQLTGELASAGDVITISADLSTDSGITARAQGPLTGPQALQLALAATVPRVQDFAPGIDGPLSLDATMAPTDAGLSIEARANGPYDARATVETVLAGALVADFTLAIPSVAPLAPVPGGLDVTGQARQTDDGFIVETRGIGPYSATFDATADLTDGLAVSATGQIPNASQLAPQLRGPINFDASARQDGEVWTVDADVSGAQGISATVSGPATGPNANLAFEARLANVAPFAPGLSGPLSTSGRLFQQSGGYGFDVEASGPLGATLDANGTLTGSAPAATFDLRIPDIGPLVPEISGPLRAQGTARQAGEAWGVDVNLTGPAGTQATVAGTAGSTLNLTVNGQAPLGLANAVLSPNRVTGTANFDLRVNGAPGLDAVSGTIRSAGATLSLPDLRAGLEAIDTTITLSNSQANINLTANPTRGGVLTVTGPVGLTAPFNAGLAIRFDGRLEDPTLYTARIIAEVGVNGALTGGASVNGDILLDEAEIAVPSTGVTAVGELPAIQHLGATRPVQRSLARAGQLGNGEAPARTTAARGGPSYPLSITVRAPNRIFVRGRGLDAELGGTLNIGGTTNNPTISGGFELARGRLDILQQRFDLDEGSITFQGNLVPFIRLVAVTETDALTASIVVEGPATAPEVGFESSPDVPQEEILAQVFFGRDLSSLSPLQALQLANSIATLAGRGNGGLLERLRGNAGLDDLDLTTDSEGNTAIRAGKYISDNVYTDVEINQDGEPTVTLNIDLTPNLTVRGGTGTSGDTSLGLFFEKDY